MPKPKRKGWRKWEITFAVPPRDEAEMPRWHAALRAELEQQPPIAGTAGLAVTASADAWVDLPEIASTLLDLVRSTGAIPPETRIATIRCGQDKLISPGTMVIHAWRSTPPAGRISQEVRRTIAERRSLACQLMNELLKQARAAA